MAVRGSLTIALPFVLLIFATLQFRGGNSQGNIYGNPANCLTNRVDRVRCIFRQARTRQPGFNQFANYSTRIKSGGNGHPRCDIRNRNHRVRNITILGSDDRLKFIYSPGIQLDPLQTYGNQQYILFNISCRADHIAFFNMTNINMQGAICTDPGDPDSTELCVDYVRAERGATGTPDVCGDRASDAFLNQFQEGNFGILFRSSTSVTMNGFQLSVICFRREDGSTEEESNCTRPVGGEEPSIPPTTETRRKRDLEEFHGMWRKELEHLKRRKRQTDTFEFRYEEFIVPIEVEVFYSNNTLSFRPETFRDPISNIFILNTFDGNGDTRFFQRDAEQQILRGPGPLIVLTEYAYFQLFIIDPRGIMPTPAEMVAISDLTQAQFDVMVEDNSTRLSEEDRIGPCFDPVEDADLPPDPQQTSTPCPPDALGNRRIRRQTDQFEQSSELFPDSAIVTAIRNENACNAVLRVSALSTIKFMEETAEGRARLQAIRDELAD